MELLLCLLSLLSTLGIVSSKEMSDGSHQHHRSCNREPSSPSHNQHNRGQRNNKSADAFKRTGYLGHMDIDYNVLITRLCSSTAAAEQEKTDAISNVILSQQPQPHNEEEVEEGQTQRNHTLDENSWYPMESRYRQQQHRDPQQQPAKTITNTLAFEAWRRRDEPSVIFSPEEDEEEGGRDGGNDNFSGPAHNHSRDYMFKSLHEEDSDEEGLFSFRDEGLGEEEEEEDITVDEKGNMVPDFPAPATLVPLAYRFYRRALCRQRASDSLPFVLLGPNVDHWKATAQELAAAGFSVICCERVHEDSPRPEDENDEYYYSKEGAGFPNNANRELSGPESAKVISDLLDALRWGRAVLVACDSESVLAIQAAMQLAPENRIVGLVLCGQLEDAEEFVNSPQGDRGLKGSSRQKSLWGSFVVDGFLRQHVRCPSLVVWDGDSDTLSQQQQEITASVPPALHQEAMHYVNVLAQERAEIFGSGFVPHRKLPELLAWHLTRFVERKISPVPEPSEVQPRASNLKDDRSLHVLSSGNSGNMLFDEISQFFSQEGMVVLGRILANVLLWGSAIRAGLFQYRNFRNGIFDFHTKLTLLSSAPAKLVSLLGQIVPFVASTRKCREPEDPTESAIPHENETKEDIESARTLEDDGEDQTIEPDRSAEGIEEHTVESPQVEDKSPEGEDDMPESSDKQLDDVMEGEEDEDDEDFIPNYFMDFVLCQARISNSVSFV